MDTERALLFRPEPESGCGAEAEGIDAPKGYCAVAEIKNGDDPRDEEDSTRRRQLQARSSIVGPAYNTGPRGIGSNVNFNSGRIYGSGEWPVGGREAWFVKRLIDYLCVCLCVLVRWDCVARTVSVLRAGPVPLLRGPSLPVLSSELWAVITVQRGRAKWGSDVPNVAAYVPSCWLGDYLPAVARSELS